MHFLLWKMHTLNKRAQHKMVLEDLMYICSKLNIFVGPSCPLDTLMGASNLNKARTGPRSAARFFSFLKLCKNSISIHYLLKYNIGYPFVDDYCTKWILGWQWPTSMNELSSKMTLGPVQGILGYPSVGDSWTKLILSWQITTSYLFNIFKNGSNILFGAS